MMANLKHSAVPCALVSALLLSGCVSPAVTQQVRGHVDSSLDATRALNRSLRVEESTPGHQAATNAAAVRQLNPIVARRASRPWIGSEMIEISSEDSLPAVFDEAFTISFDDKSTAGKVTLAVWAERMTRITGVPFRIKQDVYEPAASAGAATPAAPGQPPRQGATAVAGVSLPAPLAGSGGAIANVQQIQEVLRPGPSLMLDAVEMNWKNGTPRGITEFVTARLGLSYAFRDGVLIIERYVTETFEIAALEGSKDFAMNLQGGSSTGSSGTSGATGNSTSNFRVDETGTLDTFNSFMGSLQQMVRAVPGSSIAINQGTGRFAVTTTKEAMQRIRQVVKSENESLRRQVRIQMDIYSVTSKDGDEKGVNWGAVLNSLTAKWGATIDSPTSLVSDTAGQAGLTILSSGNGGNASSGTVARWGGSQATVQALNEYGTNIQHLPLELLAMNRQWARKTKINDKTYVSETLPSTSTAAGSGSVGMKTSNVTTGDRFMVQPAILDDDSVILRFGISMTNLIAMTETTSGAGASIARVQNPEKGGGEEQSTILLKAGQVMVLTGMARSKAKDNRRRLAEGWSLLTGGSDAQSMEREEFLVVMRPVLMK